ncbi:MAG: RecB-family nuclease [Vulcanisaeta sp.]|uniref:RecB-family nuclease n=1 Tax=Vulcanisaeta sp. EB80 TaxID=1650660 RepID=UPI000748D9EA|nr:RecB-family nuclease [Vulcanisaeta sp. EB80]KUO80058.1 MAG: recombinase RecB [Vulcanisaeta sp. JCHS_4]KUO81847.1 MAG: recombinase RecB [Vulcanisaeta sp. OSP_8]KUO87189.1 MAG: recombinase RecB [Vulcanisaeta sp. MG_3]KUO92658.1 MAG: recombinase RecB [Vulcanisaeta sp. CIS_19]MCG2864962.1 RecB-family nuclease [Vulcanisaeta sp.]
MECQEAVNNVIPVIHNPASVQKLLDAIKVSLGFGVRTIVVTKAVGSAAQQGIPEAFRLVMRVGASLIVLPDIRDAVELLKPDHIYFLSTKGEIMGDLNGRVLLIVQASDQQFMPSELNLGRQVRVLGRDVGSTALLTLALNKILGSCIE